MNKLILVLLVCLASTQALQIESNQAKGITDFIVNTFGLQSVWGEIETLGQNLLGQFQSILTQLLFAGQEKWQQAQQIFNTLVYDLTNHIGNASTIVTDAIQQLAQILSNGGKRDLVDFFLNTLGLGSIWGEIQNVGANLLAQFTAEIAQLVLSGQQVLAQAKPILQQLATDLINHTSNASTILQGAVQQLAQILSNGGKRDLADFFLNTLGLGNIWGEIQNVGANLLAQFTAEITQLIFSGQQVLAQAQPILQQLASDLLNHTNNASTILQGAVQQLGQLLSNGGKRGLADFFLNTLGLGSIWGEIQNVGANLLAQFTAEITQLIFSGQQVLAQAQPILQQLASDLLNHTSNASTILQGAVQQLGQLLNNGGKRDLADFFLNTLGLGNIWGEIQNVGANLLAQFTAEITQLIFSGQQVLAQAKPILQQLASDLLNHTNNASTILQGAVQQLGQLLNNGGKRDLADFIINTFGLQSVWAEIQSLGQNLLGQFQSILAQLLFAGTEKWQQAQQIFNTLVYDLTNHVGNASTIVTQTIQQLSQLLSNGNANGKRGLKQLIH